MTSTFWYRYPYIAYSYIGQNKLETYKETDYKETYRTLDLPATVARDVRVRRTSGRTGYSLGFGYGTLQYAAE